MDAPFWTSRMTLYTDSKSVAGHILRLLIAEKECPCDVEIVDENDPPHILQLANPDQKLPMLTDKMLALMDYNTIVLYLQERFPAAEFLPEHPKLRAQIRQVCAFISQWADKLDNEEVTREWRQHTMDDITQLLEPGTPWLLGHEFTLADIYASALIHKLFGDGDLEVSTTLYLYMDRLFARDSFAQSEKLAA